MRQTEPILIADGNDGSLVQATLLRGVTLSDMVTTDAQWMPFLNQSVKIAIARGVPRYDLPEHKHWEWERKARAMGSESLAFAIEADAETQALMIIRRDKTCRLPEQLGEPMIYVDYLATAPWNLTPLVKTPRYRQCGTQILLAAVQYSQQIGYAGRIGLHSLQEAEGFYRDRFLMHDLGIDQNYEGLRYFELAGDDFI